MSGREEIDAKLKEKMIILVENQPEYIKEYYRSMSRKTNKTKFNYLRYVIDFLNYIRNITGYNMSDIEQLNKIKYSDINGYISYLEENGNKESIMATKVYAIKNFFLFLIKNRYINFNPALDVEAPKVNTEPNITSLTQKEIKIVLNNINNGSGSHRAKARQDKWKSRDKALVMLGITNGLRVSAITEINMNDIDFNENTIKVVEKGGVSRTCYIPENTMNAINEWISDREIVMGDYMCDALFISNRIRRMTPATIEALIKKYTYNIDKHITPHKLRSTCATNLYQKTGDIYLTADILGHKNLQNTRKYAQVSKEQKLKAADILNKLV